MKYVFLSLCFLGLFAPAADADLRYRLRVDVRTTATQLKAAMPPGETVMLVKGDAIRIEQGQGTTRSVLLLRPDGRFLIDLDARTYRRIPEMPAVLTSAAATAAPPAFRRTGEFTTILGLQAERVEVAMTLPLPNMPAPGFPAVMPMTGELWVADAYRAYANHIGRATGLPGAVTSELEGIVLRQVVRNATFGIEIEHVVTELIEAPVAAEAFDLPEGFRGLTSPAGRR